MNRKEMLDEVFGCVEDEGTFPGSDSFRADTGRMILRFRWASGAWFCYVIGNDKPDWQPWRDDAPWPVSDVDVFVADAERLSAEQLARARARSCLLHDGQTIEACGCPTMYEVLVEEQRRRAERTLATIVATAAAKVLPPPHPIPSPGPATAAAPAGLPVASAPAGATPIASRLRCLDCAHEVDNPPMPASGWKCPRCAGAGVFVWRAEWPKPPHVSYADRIASDGEPWGLDGSACYVCSGPLSLPGGAACRVRKGHQRAHLACVQEQHTPGPAVDRPFIRVGDPTGYCRACRKAFAAGELTLLGGKVHASFAACQAGPSPPEVAPPSRVVGRQLKELCVVCADSMVKGAVVCAHLDGTAHVTCVMVPSRAAERAPFEGGAL